MHFSASSLTLAYMGRVIAIGLCVCVCGCVLSCNLENASSSLFVEPIAGANVSPSDKRFRRFL